MKGYRGDGPFGAWVYRIAWNVLRRHTGRRSGSAALVPLEDEDGEPGPVHPDGDPLDGPGEGRALASVLRSERRQILRRAIARLRSVSPAVEVRLSPLTGSAEVLHSRRGGLTGPARGRGGEEIALGFLRSHAEVYGLTLPEIDEIRVLGWAQVTFTRETGDWYTVVAARDGTLLYRKNLRNQASNQEARFNVYVQADGVTPADSPAPASPTNLTPGGGTQFPHIDRRTVLMSTAQDIAANPDGWIPDGGTTTTGNNVDAYLDTDGNDQPDPLLLDNAGRPRGNPDAALRDRDFLGTAPRSFAYTPPPASDNPDLGDSPSLTPFRRGIVTQLFYTANWFHDQLFALGFDEAAGNAVALQLVTDALKMTPNDPTYVDARDALLDADCATNGCAHEEAIWAGFADRGLGYGAATSAGISTHYGVLESFDSPFLDVAGVTIDDSAGNGNGAIDPGETISITVELTNPWRSSTKDVGLTFATLTGPPEVTVTDSIAAYLQIPAGGQGIGSSFSFDVDPSVACGRALVFSLETDVFPGTASFTLRVGTPAGTGVPVTLTRAIPGGLPIPDDALTGVTDTMFVTEDLEILDLDFRLDRLSHTWVGDLSRWSVVVP